MKTNRKIAAALTVSAVALSGCYVVPMIDAQGQVLLRMRTMALRARKST